MLEKDYTNVYVVFQFHHGIHATPVIKNYDLFFIGELREFIDRQWGNEENIVLIETGTSGGTVALGVDGDVYYLAVPMTMGATEFYGWLVYETLTCDFWFTINRTDTGLAKQIDDKDFAYLQEQKWWKTVERNIRLPE